MTVYTLVPTSCRKFLIFYLDRVLTVWKVLENRIIFRSFLEGPEKSWKVLEFFLTYPDPGKLNIIVAYRCNPGFF